MAQKTPLIILKEVIYSKLLDLPYKEGQVASLPLDIDIAPTPLRELFLKYTSKFGSPPGIYDIKYLKELRMTMAMAMRHKDSQDKTCYSVAFQALEKGLPYVKCGASKEARTLNQLAKEVTIEINQNKYLEFSYNPQSPSVIFAYCNLYHNTADLILKHYAKLYPDRTVLIYTRRHAFWVKDNEYGSSDLEHFNTENIYSRQLASV